MDSPRDSLDDASWGAERHDYDFSEDEEDLDELVFGTASQATMESPPDSPGGPHSRTPKNAGKCSVCLESFCRPTRLSCGHVFCRGCLAAVLSAKEACPVCEAWTGPPLNEDGNGSPLGLTAPIDHVVQLRVWNSHEINRAGGLSRSQKWTVSVQIDRDDLFPGCGRRHVWTEADLIHRVAFSLVPACRLLDSQGYHLPPTSSDPEVFRAPFELTGVSWGLFTVRIAVTWKDWINLPPLHLEHCLTTAGEAGDTTYRVDLGAAASGCGPRVAAFAPAPRGPNPEPPPGVCHGLRSAALAPALRGRDLGPHAGAHEIPGYLVDPPGIVEVPFPPGEPCPFAVRCAMPSEASSRSDSEAPRPRGRRKLGHFLRKNLRGGSHGPAAVYRALSRLLTR